MSYRIPSKPQDGAFRLVTDDPVINEDFEIEFLSGDEVDLVYDVYAETTPAFDAWVEENAIGPYDIKMGVIVTFEFANEKDALFFKLFWQ